MEQTKLWKVKKKISLGGDHHYEDRQYIYENEEVNILETSPNGTVVIIESNKYPLKGQAIIKVEYLEEISVKPQVNKAFAEDRVATPPSQSAGLTPIEKQILVKLAEAWNLYVSLDTQPGVGDDGKHPDENNEFRSAIHKLQFILGYRVARRIDKDVWTQYAVKPQGERSDHAR